MGGAQSDATTPIKTGTTNLTLQQSLDILLAQVAQEQSKTSQHTYRWHARNAAATWGAETLLADITRYQVQTWASGRKSEVKPATLRHEISFLSRCYRIAFEQGLRLENPTDNLRLPRVNNWRKRVLSLEEQAMFRSIMTPAQFSPIEFAVQTGLRRREQWHLRNTEVDIWQEGDQVDSRTGVTVPICKGMAHIMTSKNEKGRSVPLNHIAAACVMFWRKRNKEFVFGPDKADRWAAANWYADRIWRPAMRRLSIEDLHWHDLRHTFATRALQGGAKPEQISRVLGHSTLSMTERYLHWDDEMLWPAVMAAAKAGR